MSSVNQKKLRRRKGRIHRRLRPRNWTDQPTPMFKGSPTYEVSDRILATGAGGVGAIHTMVQQVGLDHRLNDALSLLKAHLPYFESDHILNIAYNVMAGGTKLEDIELLRHDESYMDMLGAERIPDPTTAGDFLRRFDESSIEDYQDAVNACRVGIWRCQGDGFRDRATVDVDGTLTPTTGEKKRGMGLSYKGVWGYHPLVVTLANSGEPLYVVNRPGNAPSHAGAVRWIDKAIALCEPEFEEILLRGDTDFSLTGAFDGWTRRGVRFVFGYDARPNLVAEAEKLLERDFSRLRRRRRKVKTRRRRKRENVKERIVEQRGYLNKRLEREDVAEIEYRPTKCRLWYRVVILRKTISERKGQRLLLPLVDYFFYITNDSRMSVREVIRQANERCNQENVIEQLKNGVNALRVPMYDLVSNGAYMAIASLALTLKAWFGMTLPRRKDRGEVLRMEFKRFLNQVMRIPCQVVRGARQIRVRLLAYTGGARMLLASVGATARFRGT